VEKVSRRFLFGKPSEAPCQRGRAAYKKRIDGSNQGKNAGRACWFVAGTLCGGKVQGLFANKLANCMNCDFYKSVSQEEGRELAKPGDVLARLK